MSLEEAVELVLFAFEHAQTGDIMVQKAPACTIGDLAQAVSELFDTKHSMNVIGIRHGEKMFETLLTREEHVKAIDMGGFFRVPADNRDLNYSKFFTDGDQKLATTDEYNSNNTIQLNVEQVKQKLLTLDYVKKELSAWKNRQ